MRSISDLRRTDHPHDDLTALCDQLTEQLPEDVKAIIALDSEDRGGFVAHGFDNDAEISEAFARHHRAWRLSLEEQLR